MFQIRMSPGSLPGSTEDLSEPLKKIGTALASLFNRLISKNASSQNTPPDEIPLEEMPRVRILREYMETRSKESPLMVGDGLGIQRQSNNCTIACLLFNICSMYGNTEHFEDFFTLKESDTETCEQLKYDLMDITNQLEDPYKRGCVQGFKLEKLRNAILPDIKKDAFLDPDEFITAFFEKLNISFESRFVKISPIEDQIPKSKKPISIQEILNNTSNDKPKAEETAALAEEPSSLIDEKETKVLFIQMPRQGCKDTHIKYKKNYGDVLPSPRIKIGNATFKLQSYLVNINHNHYVSYVVNEQKKRIYFFDDKYDYVDGKDMPAIYLSNGLYKVLSEKKTVKQLVESNPRHYSSLPEDYERSVQDLAYLIYVKDD